MRAGALALALAVFVLPLAAGAQQSGRVYRIGVLREGPDPMAKPFADTMRELG